MSAIASAQSFRDRFRQHEEGEVIELVSGLKVRVRQPQSSKLIAEGFIPGALINASINVQLGQATDQDLVNNTELKRIMAKHTLLDPQIVDENPTEQQITMDMLTDDEIDDLYFYANGGLENLRKFRPLRQSGDTGSDSQTVSGDQA